MLKIIQSTKEEIVLQLSLSEEKSVLEKDRGSKLMEAFLDDLPNLLCGKLIESDCYCGVKRTGVDQFTVKALDGYTLPLAQKFQKVIDVVNEEIRESLREIALENFRVAVASEMSKKAIKITESESVSSTAQLIKIGVASSESVSHHDNEVKAEQSFNSASKDQGVISSPTMSANQNEATESTSPIFRRPQGA